MDIVGYAVLSPDVHGAPTFETEEEAQAFADALDEAMVLPVVNLEVVVDGAG